MKPFEIFRSGRHTSSQGATLTFGDNHLAAIAAGYDASLHHAPIVVGHPKTDAPAYGWVDGLSVNGDRLVADPGKLDPAFADLVKEGKFRKVSAAFYQPDSPNNPTPGSYYLRHVGFLGAAAPAVKGLKPIEFADDDLVVEFDDIEFIDWRQSWAIDACSRLFRGIRDWLIEEKDLETANRVVPEWDVNQLTTTAAELRAEGRAEAERTFSETTKEPDPMTKPGTAAPAAADLDARERDIAAREAEFAERERTARAADDAAFVDGVVKAGRLPIGLQAQAVALFSELDDDELTFSEDGEEKKTTGRAAFRDLLEKLPVPVPTGEFVKGDAGLDFNDPLSVAAAIDAEIKSAADKGEIISAAAAANRLGSKK